MISIPGRNGSFALDKGRFENIEVTYPAGIYAQTESDFAQGISDFRNFLASRQGYVELSDDYNTGEYRLAVYKSGLDVSPEQLRAGEFEITFECKPQRFLTSGETEETIANGGTITNPTLFDARPMLEVWGAGTIEFGGQSVTVNGSAPIGMIQLAPASYGNYSVSFDQSILNNGDVITDYDNAVSLSLLCYGNAHGIVTDITAQAVTGALDATNNVTIRSDAYGVDLTTSIAPITYAKGTGSGDYTQIVFTVLYADNTTDNITVRVQQTYLTTGTIIVAVNETLPTGWSVASRTHSMGEVVAYSTKLSAGSPCYIDLDIGEAYKEVSGSYVSLNNTVEIGGDLPVLPPGVTTFTIPNTVTQFKVIPRWWKV